MTRVSIRHGGMLKCAGRDASGKACQTRFHTHSLFRLTRTQATAAGWTRQIAWHITGNREDGVAKADACPEHTVIAEQNRGRSKELVAADRAARRAARDQAAADKTAAFAKKKQDWAAARAAKAAAKEDRATKRAAQAATKADKAAVRTARAKERFESKVARPEPAPTPAPTPPKPRAKKKTRTMTAREQRQADTRRFAEQATAQSRRQRTLPDTSAPPEEDA